MKINKINNSQSAQHRLYLPVFKTYNLKRAEHIERELAKKGISSNFYGNDFMAECVKNVTQLFEKLFGHSSLPNEVKYEDLGSSAYGCYNNFYDNVLFNRNFDKNCYDNIEKLKDDMKTAHRHLLPNWFSSLHPAHTFVHEYSHSAHWHNLLKNNGYANAQKVWEGLEGVGVPTSIGRLISRYKLGNYAVDSKDMCEFMAERMTQDICGGITDIFWTPFKDIDVKYYDIFSRKWKYRYSTPQSYVDYFTQQVWNGNIDEAKRTGEMVEEYLAKIDAQKVAPTIQKLENKTKNKSGFLSQIGEFLSDLSEAVTNTLDRRNNIYLKQRGGL